MCVGSFGVMLGSCWCCVGVMLVSSWDHVGVMWGHVGVVSGSFGSHDGVILGILRSINCVDQSYFESSITTQTPHGEEKKLDL
jgi:hypothetical protein